MSMEIKQNPYQFCGGNAAAMREALEDSQSLLESFSLGEYGEQIRAQMQDNQVALDTPARNCDRFEDAETARKAWLDDADNWDDFGSPELELYEWLFALETRKGEQS